MRFFVSSVIGTKKRRGTTMLLWFMMMMMVMMNTTDAHRRSWHVYEGKEPTRFCYNQTWSNENVVQTCVSLSLEDSNSGLSIRLEAKGDSIQENAYLKCNEDIYNQEVMEVFISNETEKESPEYYWEIEMSPRGTIWLGYDFNPGGDRHALSHTLYPCSDVSVKILNEKTQWTAILNLTYDQLGKGGSDCGENCKHYRANFFRVQMNPSIWKPYVGHITRDQNCSPENCTFSCAIRPDTPAPDFHQTKYFGDLYLHLV